MGKCYRCREEIGYTAAVMLDFAIPKYQRGVFVSTIEKKWVHVVPEDCDGLTWKACKEHQGYHYALEGGNGCEVCVGIWSI